MSELKVKMKAVGEALTIMHVAARRFILKNTEFQKGNAHVNRRNRAHYFSGSST